jgi:hypothetical protein
VSGDGPDEKHKTLRLLEELAAMTIDHGRYEDGLELYRDVLERDRAARSCEIQGRLVIATLESSPEDRQQIQRELARLIRYRDTLAQHPGGKDHQRSCARLCFDLLLEVAESWRLEALGRDEQPGTGDPETMRDSLELYRELLRTVTLASGAPEAGTREGREPFEARLHRAIEALSLALARGSAE